MSPRELAAEWADLETRAVAEADRKFHNVHGPEDEWSDGEQAAYVGLIAKVERLFRPAAVGGAS